MPQSTENLLVVGVIPLVAVIVLLARFVLKNIKDIETITLKVATLECELVSVKNANEELRKENNELHAINVKWRQAAHKWYQIAIAISPQLRDQVEDDLEEPTDL